MIRRGGTDRKVLAHRVSWELANGPIPENMCILHSCDTPLCVNPEHLFLGTLADNMADKERKGRHGRDANWLKDVRARGAALKEDFEWKKRNKESAEKRRKLTPEQENDVIRLHTNGESIHSLSRIFSIDRSCIKRIISE